MEIIPYVGAKLKIVDRSLFARDLHLTEGESYRILQVVDKGFYIEDDKEGSIYITTSEFNYLKTKEGCELEHSVVGTLGQLNAKGGYVNNVTKGDFIRLIAKPLWDEDNLLGSEEVGRTYLVTLVGYNDTLYIKTESEYLTEIKRHDRMFFVISETLERSCEEGDVIRVLDSSNIVGGRDLTDGCIYEIKEITAKGFYVVTDNVGDEILITQKEFDSCCELFDLKSWKEREKKKEGDNVLKVTVNKRREGTEDMLDLWKAGNVFTNEDQSEVIMVVYVNNKDDLHALILKTVKKDGYRVDSSSPHYWLENCPILVESPELIIDVVEKRC